MYDVIQPFIRVAVSTEEDFKKAVEENYSEIYMITTQGIFKHHRLSFGEHPRFITMRVSAIPGYDGLLKAPEAKISFLPDGKIPRHLFDEIVSLYRQVMRKHNNQKLEAMAWILWSKENGYFIHVPQQEVSAGSVKYDHGIPSGSIVVVDTHSHNSMGAFFSGTDDNDDKKGIRFSGVVGNLTDTDYKTIWRFCYQGNFIPDIKFDDIFGPATSITIPEEWLEKIEVQTYNSYARGRADHLAPYRFQPGQNTPHGGRGPRSVDDEYDDYYSSMYNHGSTRSANQNPNSGRNGATFDQRSNPGEGSRATTIDPSAKDNPRSSTSAQSQLTKITPLGEGSRGNAMAGSTAEKVDPAKDGKGAIVDQNGQPLTSTKTDSTPLEGVNWGRAALGELNGTEDNSVPDGIDALQEDYNDRMLQLALTLQGADGLFPEGEPFADDGIGNKKEDLEITGIENHPRFDEIAITFGVNAAQAFCLINELSESIGTDCDDLVKELISDFFQFLSDEHALQTFRDLFGLLSSRNQQDINTKGI